MDREWQVQLDEQPTRGDKNGLTKRNVNTLQQRSIHSTCHIEYYVEDHTRYKYLPAVCDTPIARVSFYVRPH